MAEDTGRGRRPLIRSVDALEIPVPSLEEGLRFYRQMLGHPVRWQNDTAAGLALPDAATELVLQTERGRLEIDLLVDSADAAADAVAAAGGRIVVTPFEIAIGRCAVIEDPWGNRLVLLDMSKGPLDVDEDHEPASISRPERRD